MLRFNADTISNKEYNVTALKFPCMYHSLYSSLCGEILTLWEAETWKDQK